MTSFESLEDEELNRRRIAAREVLSKQVQMRESVERLDQDLREIRGEQFSAAQQVREQTERLEKLERRSRLTFLYWLRRRLELERGLSRKAIAEGTERQWELDPEEVRTSRELRRLTSALRELEEEPADDLEGLEFELDIRAAVGSPESLQEIEDERREAQARMAVLGTALSAADRAQRAFDEALATLGSARSIGRLDKYTKMGIIGNIAKSSAVRRSSGARAGALAATSDLREVLGRAQREGSPIDGSLALRIADFLEMPLSSWTRQAHLDGANEEIREERGELKGLIQDLEREQKTLKGTIQRLDRAEKIERAARLRRPE